MQEKRKKWLYALFVAVVFAVTLWTVFGGEDLSRMWDSVVMAENRYLYAGVICVLLFILCEAASIWYLLRSLGCRIGMGHCALYSFIGFFYSCITPSASGGQPMQVVAMRKDNVPVAVSSIALLVVTIAYKTVLIFMGGAVCILRPEKIMRYLQPAIGFVYLGIFLNVCCVVPMLLLIFFPNIVRKSAGWIFRVIQKIRPFRAPDKMREKLEKTIRQYEGASDYFRQHPYVIGIVFGIAVLQRCILFLVTWFTYLAFSLQGESMGVITSLQAMVSVSVDMLPLPGGMGVSENLFLRIFEPVFGEKLVLPGMVLSRGISFYSQIVICAVMTLVSMPVLKQKTERTDDEHEEKDSPDRVL